MSFMTCSLTGIAANLSALAMYLVFREEVIRHPPLRVFASVHAALLAAQVVGVLTSGACVLS